MEDLILNFAKYLVTTYPILSFLFFFISQSLQILFPPYPGDMILIMEGYLAGLANLNLFIVIFNAISATFLSSALLFNIGKKEKEKILHSKLINYLFKVEQIKGLEKLFKRFGPITIVVSKFIPGIFSLTVLCAGIFQVNKKHAYLGIFIITAIHHTTLVVLGKVLEENWKLLFDRINYYDRYIFIFILLGVIFYTILNMIKKRIFE